VHQPIARVLKCERDTHDNDTLTACCANGLMRRARLTIDRRTCPPLTVECYLLPTELRSHFLPNYGCRDFGVRRGGFAELLRIPGEGGRDRADLTGRAQSP